MISNNELVQIKGGTSKIKYIGVVIAAVVTFVVGVIDGQARLKWQNLKNTELIGNLREKPLIQIRRKD